MSRVRPIALQPLFLIGLAAVLLFDSGNNALAALLASLWHEAGHLIAMKYLRVPIKSVAVSGLKIEIVSHLHLSSQRIQTAVAAAGIVANIAAALLTRVLLCAFDAIFLQTLFYANLVIAAVNLTPLSGLDGGDLYDQMIFSVSSGILKKTALILRVLLLTVVLAVALLLLWRHHNPILCLFLLLVAASNRKGKKLF